MNMGPRIVRSGLVLALDAASQQSLIGEPTSNLALNCPQYEGATKLMTVASNYAPVNTTAHSSLAVSTDISPPVSGMTVYKITDSNPDYYSRFGIGQSGAKILVTDIGNYDVTYCASIYIYIPSSISLPVGTSTLGWVTQNSTGVDWHTGNYPTPNPTYGYYSGDIYSSQITVDTSLRNVWQRAYIIFTPSSTVRDYGGVNNCKYITIQFRPNLTGQSGANYIYVSALQIEQRNYPSAFIAGNRLTWTDISGKLNNSSFNNNPNLNTSAGNFLTFNGTNQYVAIPNSTSLQVADTFTVSAWIKASNLSARYGIFSTRANNTTGSWQFEVGTGNGGTARILITGIGTWIAESVDNVISANQWYYISVVKINNATQGATLYVNGVAVSNSVTTAYTISNNSDEKRIATGTLSAQYFPGNIAMVSLYNRALSASEILQNYNATKGRFGL